MEDTIKWSERQNKCKSVINSTGLLEQHAGLLIFEWVGRGSDAGEQRVTASVVLTILDQVCCCEGDLGQRWTQLYYRLE